MLAELRCRLVEIRRERARLDAEEASIVREIDEIMRDPSNPEFAFADLELIHAAGLSQRDARRVIARSATLDSMPAFEGALASGAVTAAHVDALSVGLGKLSDADKVKLLDRSDNLLSQARHLSVDEFSKQVRVEVARAQSDGGLSQFERQRRSTYLKIWNDTEGMVQLRGAFDPERGTVLAARLEARVETLFHSGDQDSPVEVMPGIEPNDHRRALALLESPHHRSFRRDGVRSSLDSIALVSADSHLVFDALQLSRAEPPVPRDDVPLGGMRAIGQETIAGGPQRVRGLKMRGPDAVDGPNATRSARGDHGPPNTEHAPIRTAR